MAAEDARDPQDPQDPQDPLSRYFQAVMGLTELTRKRAEKVARSLVQQGEAGGNPKVLVENLLERSHENREALVTLVRGETKRAMKAMGLATTNDVERLEQQLKALRRELADARDAGPSDAQERATRTAAKKTGKKAAKKTGKKAAKKTGKKAAKKAAKKAGKKAAKKTTKKKSSS